jgi:NAD(P)H-dependent FMN reductase
MPKPAKLLFLAGSSRSKSFNKQIAKTANALAQKAGATSTYVDLKDYPLPLFDEDLEASEGQPAQVTALKELFKNHDGIFFACPEYNSSVTPLWKNMVDWCSRQSTGEPLYLCTKGKIVALASASPGGYGGLRGLVHYRQILGNIGAIVLPDQFLLAQAHEAFSEEGTLKDEAQTKRLTNLVQSLIQWTERV